MTRGDWIEQGGDLAVLSEEERAVFDAYRLLNDTISAAIEAGASLQGVVVVWSDHMVLRTPIGCSCAACREDTLREVGEALAKLAQDPPQEAGRVH